ncbi:MAG: protein kinase domain-containing protein [Candidatus Sumerlaeaceae bacterium]
MHNAVNIDPLPGAKKQAPYVASELNELNLDAATAGFDITTPLHSWRVNSQAPDRLVTGLAPGTLLKGAKYEFILKRVLGTGGMGAVYLADSQLPPQSAAPALPREVAVKVFRNEWGTNPGELLKRELSALRALRHDRIPTLFDWNTQGQTPFVACRYYPAGSLSDEISRIGHLPLPAVWRLLEDLLVALSAAHRAAVLHLDVKPGNVLCDTDGGYLLADFGISQGFLVSKAVLPTGLGAPVFQSPEQRRADSDAFDERTDLWGAGITVWTALTGAHPLDLRNLINACAGGTHGLPPPSVLRDDCPASLEEALMPLLALDPDQRPGSAAEALARVHASNPTSSQFGTGTPSPLRPADSAVRRSVFGTMMDPLWRAICRSGELDDRLVHFRPGDLLCGEGADSYRTFVLLRGSVRIEREGKQLQQEEREGVFLGEVTSLIGAPRTATMIAITDVWALAFNPAQLEKFVTRNPAVAIRLMKVLAERLHREVQLNLAAGVNSVANT